MPVTNRTVTEVEIQELSVLTETARDLVTDLQELAVSVELRLGAGTDVEDVVTLLWQKKAKVDTLNAVALEIPTRLRLGWGGRAGLILPDPLRERFRELMADFQQLLDRESRIDGLIASHRCRLSRKLR